jgi:hypothetical protein
LRCGWHIRLKGVNQTEYIMSDLESNIDDQFLQSSIFYCFQNQVLHISSNDESLYYLLPCHVHEPNLRPPNQRCLLTIRQTSQTIMSTRRHSKQRILHQPIPSRPSQPKTTQVSLRSDRYHKSHAWRLLHCIQLHLRQVHSR